MSAKIKCIMLVDDNEDDNFFHKSILEETNIAEHIQVTESGIEAIEYLQKTDDAPGLIFLDINMPKMNGWEFLEEYNQLNIGQKAKVIIIMLTTSLNPADKEKAALIPDISGFETKPLTAEMITRVMDKYFPDK